MVAMDFIQVFECQILYLKQQKFFHRQRNNVRNTVILEQNTFDCRENDILALSPFCVLVDYSSNYLFEGNKW